MPNNYPLIYKKIVIDNYYKNNLKNSDLLKTFNISNGSLYNWINKSKTDNLNEKKKYVKQSKYTPHIKCYIRSYVLRKKIFNCNALISLLKKKYDITASKTSIYEILKYMDLTRKRVKRKVINKKLNMNELKKIFKQKVKSINKNNIISIDEMSIDTNLLPLYGWNHKGKKLELKTTINKKRYTVICGISNNRIIHYDIIKNSANAMDFKNFIINVINKSPDIKYLLVDNARIHHSKIVKDYINTTEKELLFNVPYTPEYNPIEHLFSKVKGQ